MKRVSRFSVLIIVLALCGCASGRLDKIENKLYRLERSFSQLEKGMLENDQNIKNELRQLHKETEQEIKRIRSKTDKFTVRQNSGTLLFEPTKR